MEKDTFTCIEPAMASSPCTNLTAQDRLRGPETGLKKWAGQNAHVSDLSAIVQNLVRHPTNTDFRIEEKYLFWEPTVFLLSCLQGETMVPIIEQYINRHFIQHFTATLF